MSAVGANTPTLLDQQDCNLSAYSSNTNSSHLLTITRCLACGVSFSAGNSKNRETGTQSTKLTPPPMLPSISMIMAAYQFHGNPIDVVATFSPLFLSFFPGLVCAANEAKYE
ncbi:unnamed protein product [Ceratitis capitata]|uniref:(Mediterranean fruit fly) hypothetical protein n=1 Tax=Ceratitis capitata TaxID=7213 RepID=A0A811UXU5_CERCA|nr:unnamed protein product [Ceratitis capitata]